MVSGKFGFFLLTVIISFIILSHFSEAADLTDCTDITSPGDYYLIQDITPSSPSFGSYCINIFSNNVTFDCQNHLVQGDNIADIGVYVSRSSQQTTNITIRNCNVTEWDEVNLYLENANRNNLINITLLSSPDYILYLYNSDYNNLTNITVSDSDYYGPLLYYSDFNTLTNFKVSEINNGDCFYLTYSNNNTLTNITASSSPYSGFWIKYSNNNTLTNVTAFNNGYGIIFDSSNSNEVKNSVFQNNSIAGIWMYATGQIGANQVYNCLLNNTDNINFESTVYSNHWNTTNQIGTRIYGSGTLIGGNYWTNSTGNDFSDTCTDSNYNGFCDSSYNVKDNKACQVNMTIQLQIADTENLEDSYTNITGPDTTYGSKGKFLLNASSDGVTTYSKNYIKFNISSIKGSQIINATLSLNSNSGSSQATVHLRELNNDTWTEDTITWNNAPQEGNELDAKDLISGWNYYNVTSWVQNRSQEMKDNVSFCFYSLNDVGVGLSISDPNTKESSYKPYLKITYTSCSNNTDYLPLSDEYVGCGYYVNSNLNLDHDITGCTGTIFYINASDVTLDCQNHYLQSSGSYGINNTGFGNVTIKNCIVNMSSGSSDYGIYFVSGADNGTLDGNTVTVGYDDAIYLSSNDNNAVFNNTATAGHMDAIHLESSSNNSVFNNIAEAEFSAISLYSSSDNIISNNNATASGSTAIYIRESSKNNITNNSATANEIEAIHLYESSDNIISNKNATAGTTYAISLSLSPNNIISNNTATASDYAIDLSLSSNNNIIFNNNVTAENTVVIGIYYVSNNTITGGSYMANNSDYKLEEGSTNSFRDTNFTAPREIYFYDTTSRFNYNNATAGGVWVNTSVSAASILSRKLISWTQSLVQWNDTNTTGTGITATYNVNGLLSDTYYNVYNNSVLAYTLQTDSNGDLPSFTIYLGSEHEIKVEVAEAEVSLTGKVLFWENATAVSGATVVAKIYDGPRFLVQGSNITDSSGNYLIKISYDFQDYKTYLANITVTKGSYQAYLKHYFRM